MAGHIYPSRQTVAFLFTHRIAWVAVVYVVHYWHGGGMSFGAGPSPNLLGQVSWEDWLLAFGYYIHSLIEDALV